MLKILKCARSVGVEPSTNVAEVASVIAELCNINRM